MTETPVQRLAGFEVAGIAVITSNDNGRATEDINALWQRFYNESIVDRIPGKLGTEIFAVYSHYEGDHTKPYRLTIGCRVAPENARKAAQSGLDTASVPDGAYKTHYARGPQPQALVKTWAEIWESGTTRSFIADYEIYGPRFFEAGLHEIIVQIGLKD